MHAWRVSVHGGVDQLKLEKVSRPKAKQSEALIKIRAAGLNHLDIWARKGVPGHHFPLPMTLGCDAAGEIIEFGPCSEDEQIALGRQKIDICSRVLIQPLLSCGVCLACREGEFAICPQFGLLGETRDGVFADFVRVPVRNLLLMADHLEFESAAALPIAYTTAWSMLVHKARVRPGDLILVQAGGSGVSVAAIQFSKAFGCRIATTISSEEKASKAKTLGADWVVNYRDANYRGQLKEIAQSLGKRGFDFVIDHVGADTFAESLRLLDWGGSLITCGATSGSSVQIDLKPIFFKNLSIMGNTMGRGGDLERILRWVEQGGIQPLIDKKFDWKELPEAVEYLEGRQAFGKVVLVNSSCS